MFKILNFIGTSISSTITGFALYSQASVENPEMSIADGLLYVGLLVLIISLTLHYWFHKENSKERSLFIYLYDFLRTPKQRSVIFSTFHNYSEKQIENVLQKMQQSNFVKLDKVMMGGYSIHTYQSIENLSETSSNLHIED